jgi:putative two-component system response regulator
MLAMTLQADYAMEEASSGKEALGRIAAFKPGLVLLDIVMPGIDGHETCRHLKACWPHIRVMMVSATSSAQEQLRAFEAGADDYVVKPFDPQDFCARIRLHFQLNEAMIGAAAIRGEIESRNVLLRQEARRHNQDMIALQDIAVFTLAKVAESRDQETGGHLTRMRAYSQILAEELARGEPYGVQIDTRFLEDLFRSSPLHDIGKVGIPDRILLKAGRLAPEEFEIMKNHAEIGAQTLDATASAHPEAKFLCMARDIARCHHEKFDGSGYPNGLAGEEIPLCGRIVALADVYDALTTKRVYKPAFSHEETVAIIREGRGRHFDPDIVDAFEANEQRFVAIREELTRREEQEAAAIAQQEDELVLQ